MCGNCQRGFLRLKWIWRTSAFDRLSVAIPFTRTELIPQLLREVFRDTAFVVLDELKSRKLRFSLLLMARFHPGRSAKTARSVNAP
jgi:hypothetical protein